MQRIDQHICELLYDHDCVIVPQLGGFLASYSGATLHPGTHTVFPPARKVAFNVFLKHNDGLLASRISSDEHVSYSEGLRSIEQYVSACQKELDQGLRVRIDRVGTLYQDAERNLQFEPDSSTNFLPDSFGLGPIRYLPLTRPGMPVQRTAKEVVTIRPSVRPEKKPVRQPARHMPKRVLSMMLVTGAVLWMGVNLFVVLKDKNILQGSNAPIATQVTPQTNDVRQAATEAALPPAVTTETTAAIISFPETTAAEVETSQQEIQSAATASLEVKKEPVAAPTPQPIQQAEQVSTEAHYFVIAGAFKIPSNAEGKVEELRRQGFSNARILQSRHPLTLVCYEGYANRREAMSALDSLTGDHKEGWVFKGE